MEFHWVREPQSVCPPVAGHIASVLPDDVITNNAARKILGHEIVYACRGTSVRQNPSNGISGY